MKTCKKCECEKEVTEFYNQKRYKDNLDPICKVCRDKTSRQYYLDNKERIDKYRNEYIKKNYDKIAPQRKEYYLNNKERYKEYYRNYKRKKKDETRD